MVRLSPIMIGVSLYFLSIGVYCFVQPTQAWNDYYNHVNAAICLLLGISALVKRKTEREKYAITYVVVYKALCLLYYIIGDFSGNRTWMNVHVSFVCMIGISGYLAWRLRKNSKNKTHEFETN